MVAAWKKVPTVEMDDVLRERIISQTAASFGKIPMEQMERTRDNRQVALLRALGNAHASGTQKQ